MGLQAVIARIVGMLTVSGLIEVVSSNLFLHDVFFCLPGAERFVTGGKEFTFL